jgi:hypothetical protein
MAETVQPEVQKWLGLIAAYDKEFASWEKRVTKILERYTDKNAASRKRAKFNILWSNVQTLVPAVFSRLPKPDVSRRFKDNDPVGRVAALLMERALEFEIEHYGDYKASLTQVVKDRFLGGRGTTWIRYEPHFGSPDDGVEVTEDQDEPTEVLDYECAPVDYVHWRDFGHAVARTWEEVPTIWRKVYMARPALVARFGDALGKKIPLDTRPEELKQRNVATNDSGQFQACIYEIWDKDSGQAIWLSKSMGQILDRRDDPLGLEEFWPCPKPLYATLTTDSLIPTPDYTLYQDQAEELDTLADTIDGLIKALRVRGVYDASIPELARIFTEAGNNDLIAVKNWAAFVEKQGFKGAIDLIDLTPIANALSIAYEASDKVIQAVYEVSGISDIVRGATDPRETLGAQEMKGQYATLRLRDMQMAVAQFATEILKIKAQIICDKFQPQTILQIGAAEQLSEADKPYLDQALQLLKSANMRDFRIEVEADSLVQLDENAEKEHRVEFLGAVGGFIKQAIEAPPQLVPLLAQLLKFGVTGFKVGKTIEGDIDQFVEQAKQMAQQAAMAPPPPDPEMVKAQAQMQLEQGKAQIAQQLKQAEMQASYALEQQKAELQARLELHKQQVQAQQVEQQNQIEAQRAQLEAAHQAQIEDMKRQHEAAMKSMEVDFNRWKTQMDNDTKILIADMQAKVAMDTAAQKAQADVESTKVQAKAQSEQADKQAKATSDSGKSEVIAAALAQLKDAIGQMSRPKTIAKTTDGRYLIQ